MTRPITVGVDGTAESLAAVHWAAREAVRRSLPLRVVHAWEKSDDEGRAGDVREALGGDRTGGHRTAPGSAGDHRRHRRRPGRGAGRRGGGGRDAGARHPRARRDRRLPARLGRPAGDRRVRRGPSSSYAPRISPSPRRPGREIVVGQQGGPEDSAAALEFAFETAAARGAGRTRRTGLEPAHRLHLQPRLAEARSTRQADWNRTRRRRSRKRCSRGWSGSPTCR